MQIIERLKGHYEAQEIAYGVVYTWCPQHVVVECTCGKRAILTASTTTCGECGADHKAVIREGLDVERLGDEAAHPWRYRRTSKNSGLPF